MPDVKNTVAGPARRVQREKTNSVDVVETYGFGRATGRENQNAHEVSRDLTAWALPGIGPILLASWLRAWARLGPISVKRQGTAALHRRLIATR